MKNIANLLLLFSLTLFTGACQKESVVPAIESDLQLEDQFAMVNWGSPIFEDNFNNGLGKWLRVQRQDYNSAFCQYEPGQTSIGYTDGSNDGSVLRLKAEYVRTGSVVSQVDGRTYYGNQFKSGHVKSRSTFQPSRGQELRFEWRAKLQVQRNNGQYTNWIGASTGAFPALWTVNESSWPRNGEIDVMEAFANKRNGGGTSFSSNLFYGNSTGTNLVTRAKRDYWVNDGWRKYEMIWKHNHNGSKEIIIYIDGNQVAYYNNSTDPNLNLNNFRNHNIIMNMNVGDTRGDIWDPYSLDVQRSANLWVDYIKVYRRSL